MGLTAAVAVALKRELKAGETGGEEEDACETMDPALVRQWCEFYAEELLPDTKKFVKKTSSKLDAYGLYLPSRMSASVPQELLERGLKLGSVEETKEEQEGEELAENVEVKEKKEPENVGKLDTDQDEGDVSMAMSSSKGAATSQAVQDEYDEYEYDEYDEYDEE